MDLFAKASSPLVLGWVPRFPSQNAPALVRIRDELDLPAINFIK